MIITCKKTIPLRWIAFSILPWASCTFSGYVVGVAFLFSLKKFIENPAGLTFILSLPGFISVALQPCASFISDRIWTRFGRRKPFVGTALIGVMVCLMLMPLMPNFWSLLAVFMLVNVFTDLNSPMEPLQQEIIPPHERGRATGAMTWCNNLACMVFFFVALGRFDDVRYMGGVPLFGESAIYWSAGLLMSMMVLLVMLGIKETDPKSALRGERLAFKTFFGGLMDRELWPVFMLVVGSACLNFYAGLGPLSNLLYTEQWGYTKQEMGINVAVGGIINVFAIGLLTFFADKLNRMRAYQSLICLSLGGNALYYFYINFVLPDQRPSLVELIVFGETLSIIAMLTGLVYVPLVYDYIRRNKMGTYNAGATMITRLTILITLNGVGLFVWGYAALFQPPAGEMTRVVLSGEHNEKSEVIRSLRAATWASPKDGAPTASSNVSANAWQANGVVSKTGRCWEIRLRDKESEKLADEKTRIDSENSPLITEQQVFRDQAASLKSKGDLTAAALAEKKADDKKSRSEQLTAQAAEIEATLKTRAENFHAQVAAALGNRIMADGEQVLAAKVRPALVIELNAAQRPESQVLEKALADLRRARPGILDLRPVKLGTGYGLAASVIMEPGIDENALAREVRDEVRRAVDQREPGLLATGAVPLKLSRQTVLTLDLSIVEEPLETYVSPVTRVVNAVLAYFDRVPSPRRRLDATARSLRTLAGVTHVRIEPGPASKTLSVTVLLPESPVQGGTEGDAVGQRLRYLLGASASADSLPQARALYDQIEKAAATQRLTVARPQLAAAYAPMKYDYMSGYIWMFLMSLIGISITIAFCRFEARGLVSKRGIEEAQAS